SWPPPNNPILGSDLDINSNSMGKITAFVLPLEII
ncbi:MAG: hypothetical protein RJA67_926, partial [Bacteroidota bacterium]